MTLLGITDELNWERKDVVKNRNMCLQHVTFNNDRSTTIFANNGNIIG